MTVADAAGVTPPSADRAHSNEPSSWSKKWSLAVESSPPNVVVTMNTTTTTSTVAEPIRSERNPPTGRANVAMTVNPAARSPAFVSEMSNQSRPIMGVLSSTWAMRSARASAAWPILVRTQAVPDLVGEYCLEFLRLQLLHQCVIQHDLPESTEPGEERIGIHFPALLRSGNLDLCIQRHHRRRCFRYDCRLHLFHD